jgi:divalent metal cation (Fe/Co/Zn/Cd) transporter
VQSVRRLLERQQTRASALGVAVTAASVVVMLVFGIAKSRLGARLASGATTREGMQNLLCAAQVAAVLVGLALTATHGWWWLDPAVGLALAVIAVRDGREAWRGEDCC